MGPKIHAHFDETKFTKDTMGEELVTTVVKEVMKALKPTNLLKFTTLIETILSTLTGLSNVEVTGISGEITLTLPFMLCNKLSILSLNQYQSNEDVDKPGQFD